jgi:hypothetical protein
MIEKLHVHGFRRLFETEIEFTPLTILIGKNGAGKTTLLDALQLLGNFARGGVDRAFGPPPWSLGWLRSKGIGEVHAMRFQVDLKNGSQRFKYSLHLDEKYSDAQVVEERILQLPQNRPIASFSRNQPPIAGTILASEPGKSSTEVDFVSQSLRSVVSYELNPSEIEKGTDPQHDYIGREGFGIPGFLAHLKDDHPERFLSLEGRLKSFRPETQSLDVWSSGKLFWGLRDHGQDRAFPACHLSWGDRQLVGLLCVLYGTKPGSTLAIEEVDRGFHVGRYRGVLDLLTQVAYDGLEGQQPIQIVVTTHSPSFINKLSDRSEEVRVVSRVPSGGTLVRSLPDLQEEKLGSDSINSPLGELWEMGLLEDQLEPAKV